MNILNKLSPQVKYIQDNLYNGNNEYICRWLTDYLHTSHCLNTIKADKKRLSYQPSWPDEVVTSYRFYYDESMAHNHKANRIICIFESGSVFEIGLFKFKRYVRRRKYDFGS